MRMGLREANQSFSKAIKAVKAGKDVILTERGKPIAVIKPLEQERKRRRRDSPFGSRRDFTPRPKKRKADAGVALAGAHQRQADSGHDRRRT